MIVCMPSRVEQIEERRRRLRVSYRRLAKLVGMSDTGLAYILQGEAKKPIESTLLEKIEQCLSDFEDSHSISIESDPSVVRDLASSYAVRAFRGVLAAGSLDDEPFYEEEEPYEVQSAFFVGGPANADRHVVVRVSGPSLEPRVQSGERILFYLDPTPIPRAITFVESPDGRKMVKVVRTDGAKTMLASINSAGASITDTKGWIVLGYAVMILGHEDAEGRNFEWRYGKPLRA